MHPPHLFQLPQHLLVRIHLHRIQDFSPLDVDPVVNFEKNGERMLSISVEPGSVWGLEAILVGEEEGAERRRGGEGRAEGKFFEEEVEELTWEGVDFGGRPRGGGG